MTGIAGAEKDDKKIPSWTGFNTLLTTTIPPQSTIAYLPVIDASPTEMDTVKTILVCSVKYADLLQLEAFVLVFDQAIHEELKKRIVVRLGAFHTKMSYLACIGIRYKDAGLSDIFLEAGLVASGSLDGVMNGKHYNRGVQAHKIASEAFNRLRFQQFLESMPDKESQEIKSLMPRLYLAFSTQDYQKLLQSEKLTEITSAYEQFIQTQSVKNENFAFWSSYIDMVDELILFIWATHEGNWPLHLSGTRNMLPW